jgi:hypothetical protein
LQGAASGVAQVLELACTSWVATFKSGDDAEDDEEVAVRNTLERGLNWARRDFDEMILPATSVSFLVLKLCLQFSGLLEECHLSSLCRRQLSYGPPWAHCLVGYQDRLLGEPLGLPDLRCTVPDGVKHKDYRGEVLD